MALDSRPQSLTLDTLFLICHLTPTFGENALRKPPKTRFSARGASALQQNLLSGQGSGGSPVCAPIYSWPTSELLADPFLDYESEVELAA